MDRSYSQERITYIGLPQGAVLSTILYIIYTQDLYKAIPTHSNILQYADDVAIITRNKRLDICVIRMQQNLNLINSQLHQLNLQNSSSKSVEIVFTKKQTNPQEARLQINNKIIPLKTSHKFLGLILDNKLTWKLQIEELVRKCRREINLLKAIKGIKWGADQKIMLTIMKARILGKMLYGGFLFGNASDSYISKLDTIIRQAIRQCLGTLPSTPNTTTLAEGAMQPITYYFISAACKYISNKLSNTENKIDQILTDLSNNYEDNNKPAPILLRAWDMIKQSKPWQGSLPWNLRFIEPYWTKEDIIRSRLREDSSVQLINNKTTKSSFQNLISKLDPTGDSIHIYTDGSKYNSESVAAAFYDKTNKNTKSFKLPNILAISVAEMYAIYKALQYIDRNQYKKSIIFTDSKSAIQAMRDLTYASKLGFYAFHTNAILNNLIQNNHEIIIQWIPAHSGIEGNEAADEAAKQGNHLEVNKISPIQLSNNEIFKIIKDTVNSTWISSWKEENNNNNIVSITEKTWFHHKKFKHLSREDIQLITRMRSNHTRLNHHIIRIFDPSENANCPHCTKDETIHHVLLECRKYETARTILLAKLQKHSKILQPFSVQDILQNSNLRASTVEAISKFIKTTERSI